MRTAWNGIGAGRTAPNEARTAQGRAWRAEQGWAEMDFVLLAIANPRRQKRLELLPEIVRRLRERSERRVRLVIAGERAPGNRDSAEAVCRLEEAIARAEVADDMVWQGGPDLVPVLLAASDVLVSPSAYEGLSLGHLEALAAAVPVLATEVGGAPEIAREMARLSRNGYHTLPADADAEVWVERLLLIFNEQPRGARANLLPPAFTRECMARRHRLLYEATLAARVRRGASLPRETLWIVTNNLTTGGAQTSARRLAEKLMREGSRVRLITVEEPLETPSIGRRDWQNRGGAWAGLPPPQLQEVRVSLGRLLGLATAEPPRAVLFWNLLSQHKVLLADALLGVPVWDVSPGEMNFTSLSAYFEKPLADAPYRTTQEYGARLAGAVVKFATEAAKAREVFERPVAVIPNGVPSAELTQGNMGVGPFGVLVISTAARLSPEKRLEDLLAALKSVHAQMPRYELRIAGKIEKRQDAYAGELRCLAKGLPVRWLGDLPGTEELLGGTDLFVMISEPAGCPNASLEAMATGVATIVTDVGGACEQVINGHTGLLVARRDLQALGAAILQLAWDADQRRRFGAAAQWHMREHFSMDQMAARYRTLWSERT